MFFLVLAALGSAVSIISGLITMYDKSHLGSKARQTQVALGFTIVTVVVTLIFFFASIPSLGYSPGNTGNNTPVINPGTSQSSQTLPQQQPTVPPTPTPIPKPAPNTVLYRADQSWNGWDGSGGWKVSNGMLLNDGTYGDFNTRPTIIAPFQPENTSDYAIDMNMQIVKVNPSGDLYPCLYMTARGTSLNGWQGYEVATTCYESFNGQSFGDQTAVIQAVNDKLNSAPFDPGYTLHTYRLEVKGTTIRLLVDGAAILTADDSRYLTGGQIGLMSNLVEVKISSFKITAL